MATARYPLYFVLERLEPINGFDICRVWILLLSANWLKYVLWCCRFLYRLIIGERLSSEKRRPADDRVSGPEKAKCWHSILAKRIACRSVFSYAAANVFLRIIQTSSSWISCKFDGKLEWFRVLEIFTILYLSKSSFA